MLVNRTYNNCLCYLQSGRHLIIPESNTAEISEQLKIARGRLQLVPNKMFEELVMDLYDEVDRRENEASKLMKTN